MRAPLIDRAAVDDLVESIGNEGLRAVLALFLEESRSHLAIIAEATAPGADAGRQERARRAAHSLKSGAGQIGAAALAAAAAAVEQAATDGTSDLAPVIAALAECGAATTGELDRMLSALAQKE